MNATRGQSGAVCVCLAVVAVLVTVSCDSQRTPEPSPVDHGDPDPATPVTTPDDPDDPVEMVEPEACPADEAMPVADVPVRVLTTTELNNALGSIFGTLQLERYEMLDDTRVASFILNSRENLAPSHVRDFRLMAESVAVRVSENIEQVADCEQEDPGLELLCAKEAIETIGARAFRRSLTSDERDGLMQLYRTGHEISGHAEGMRYVVQAVLQSPSFMYVGERVAAPGQVHQLTGHEIAQRMALTLWRSLPDEELLADAEAGLLADPAVRERHARRMLSDPRGEEALRTMVFQWLGIDRLDAQAFAQSEENEPLVASMTAESRRLVEHVVAEEDARWPALLSAPYTFVDARLAEHYGVSTDTGEEVSEGVWRMNVPERRGILTHASFLSLHSGPVHRGLAIRKGVLCGDVAGPAGIDITSIPTEEGESERSQANKRLEHDTCSGCHLMMDPIGLTFDTFDDLGAHRTTDEHGNSVWGDGEIIGTSNTDAEYDGAAEMSGALATSDDVRHCMAKNLFVWTFGRLPRSKDSCTVSRIEGGLDEHDDSLREALVEIVADETFSSRLLTGGTE